MAVNGIDTSAASAFSKITEQSGGSNLDKDAFLQLLVTQMQYQDPLEPMDNTEYMSQLAQFSEMEAMNNLNTSFSNSQALGLVGEYVILNVSDAAGNPKQIGGLVQYVTISNNQALLRVNDDYYTMDKFDSVVDWEYVEFLNKQNSVTGSTESGGKTDGDDTDGDDTDGKTEE